MAKEPKTYECGNPVCSLGTVHNPGRFTAGITPEQAAMILGDSNAPSGDGYCPNCGQKGKAV